MIRVTCPYCNSSGYIAPPPPQTILMGPCPVCGEPVALYNSKVIGLTKNAPSEGDAASKIQSLARVIMEYINAEPGPVDGERLESIIREAEERIIQDAEPGDDESACRVSPSIRKPVDAPISEQEAKDFLEIDLNLLHKKEYFEKYFG